MMSGVYLNYNLAFSERKSLATCSAYPCRKCFLELIYDKAYEHHSGSHHLSCFLCVFETIALVAAVGYRALGWQHASLHCS